jgi:hypothetical protein
MSGTPPDEHSSRLLQQIIPVQPFLTSEQFEEMGRELGIVHDFEFGRTHWAVKEVDLEAKLEAKGIKIPRAVERWAV